MRAIDTSVLVRVIARDDAEQVAIADRYLEGGVWVSTIVLAEAVWVLSSRYKRSAADLIRIISVLLTHKEIVLEHSDFVAAALDLFRSRPALGFSDCLILQMSRKSGYLPLGTFDQDLGKCEGVQQL